jgi:hypothetical protein
MRTIVSTLALCLGLAGCQPGVAITEGIGKREPDGKWTSMGFACYLLDGSKSASTAGRPGDDFSSHSVSDHGALVVEIRSGSKVVARRGYDQDFARSHQIEKFVVRTDMSQEYTFHYRGVPDCDSFDWYD